MYTITLGHLVLHQWTFMIFLPLRPFPGLEIHFLTHVPFEEFSFLVGIFQFSVVHLYVCKHFLLQMSPL